MDSSPDISTIDLALPSSDVEINSPKDIKSSGKTKTKVGRLGLEQYYEEFKEYSDGDFKGKTSATCNLCKETVWHLKNSTSNYSRHLQRKHPVEYQLWSTNASKEKKSENKLHQITLDASLSPTSHTIKYGLGHPRQIELSKMVFNNLIIGLDLPLSITEKSSFLRAMTIVDPKFRVPSRRSITYDYLPKAYDQIMVKLKHACSSAKFIALTFDGWTDRRMRAFYAVTMHYINQIGQLKSHLLAFNSLSGRIYYLI